VSDPRVVDALGTYCPVPIRLLERVMDGMAAGETAVLLADDPLVEIDLVAWCHKKRHELLSLVNDGGEYRAEVRRVE
jgi:tRNA 2-thiouridine synthesizing protein A